MLKKSILTHFQKINSPEETTKKRSIKREYHTVVTKETCVQQMLEIDSQRKIRQEKVENSQIFKAKLPKTKRTSKNQSRGSIKAATTV